MDAKAAAGLASAAGDQPQQCAVAGPPEWRSVGREPAASSRSLLHYLKCIARTAQLHVENVVESKWRDPVLARESPD